MTGGAGTGLTAGQGPEISGPPCGQEEREQGEEGRKTGGAWDKHANPWAERRWQ